MMASKKKPIAKDAPGEKVVCRNRKARFNYDITEALEAGIVLTGTEVKSLRQGQASIEESFASLRKGELWLHNVEIPEYAMGNIMNHKVKRSRKLLLHRREIRKFAEGSAERGFTIVPLQIYFKDGLAKVEIGLARGKKLHDKRETLKKRDADRDMKRAIGQRKKGR